MKINGDIIINYINSEDKTDNPTVRVSGSQIKGKKPRRLIDG